MAADIVDGSLTVGNVKLIDIHRDDRGLAQALGQRAEGAALVRKLLLQLGAQLTAAAGNQNFHVYSPTLSVLQLVIGDILQMLTIGGFAIAGGALQ